MSVSSVRCYLTQGSHHGSSLSQKLITAGLSIAVGFVAGKVAELGWKGCDRSTAPQDDDGTASLVSVVAFAAVSAAIAARSASGVVNRTISGSLLLRGKAGP